MSYYSAMRQGDIERLREAHPLWRIGSVWASAASGPDARRLTASRDGIQVHAWDGRTAFRVHRLRGGAARLARHAAADAGWAGACAALVSTVTRGPAISTEPRIRAILRMFFGRVGMADGNSPRGGRPGPKFSQDRPQRMLIRGGHVRVAGERVPITGRNTR